jgi:hypothetical protein
MLIVPPLRFTLHQFMALIFTVEPSIPWFTPWSALFNSPRVVHRLSLFRPPLSPSTPSRYWRQALINACSLPTAISLRFAAVCYMSSLVNVGANTLLFFNIAITSLMSIIKLGPPNICSNSCNCHTMSQCPIPVVTNNQWVWEQQWSIPVSIKVNTIGIMSFRAGPSTHNNNCH